MSVIATCGCGQSYELKDEFAGKLMQCPSCGGQVRAGDVPAPPPILGDPVFSRDRFLLRQKHFAISEKYFVWDDNGQTIMFVVRPAHLFRNFLALMGGLIAGIAVITLSIAASGAIERTVGSTASGVIAFVGVLVGLFGGIILAIMLSKKRDVLFYRDDTKQELLLEVKQDQKFAFLNATFTINDPAGQNLGRLRKNYLFNLFRKRWYCTGSNGDLVCMAKEDSIVLSLLRRLLGPFFGLLRANYIIVDAQERLLGEFNRKMTLLDRYVVDFTHDSARSLDRRLGMALGVMLDTGERR